MNYAFYFNDIVNGYIKIGYLDNVVYYIYVVDKIDSDNQKNELTDDVNKQINQYLIGKRNTFDFNYFAYGTYFQKAVWNQLINSEYGQTYSYKEIAILIKKPNAQRAVGNAVNKNPLWLVIPCHRVIKHNHSIGGYNNNVDLKIKLLEIEKINKNNFKK